MENKFKCENIVRHSVVKYNNELYVLENNSRPATIIRTGDNGNTTGLPITKNTMLEVVKHPAQLAFDYLEECKRGKVVNPEWVKELLDFALLAQKSIHATGKFNIGGMSEEADILFSALGKMPSLTY